jgi:dTDP-4-amino-4,6-dideoxygalactose transaminase
LIKAKKVGKLPKIVIPVHLSGQSCDMEAIYNLGKKYGFKIIEDASHAIGGRYQDQPIGNCKYSDITIFSFHPVKIITTAEGGAALTNDVDLAERMMLLRSHGITRDPDRMTKTPDGPWYYQQIDLGFNYRMSDLQAALGVSQLERLDKYIAKRHLIAEYYDTAFSKLPVTLPSRGKDCHSSCHLYILKIKMEDLKVSRYQIFKMLRKRGIGVNLHYIPIHMQPYYQAMGFKVGDFPESEKYYESAISIPLHPGLSQKMQEHITLCLSDILNAE